MARKMESILDYQFVLQQCEVCQARFVMVYEFKEKKMVPFGNPCIHVLYKNAMFFPVEDYPTFKQWYEEQVNLRKGL